MRWVVARQLAALGLALAIVSAACGGPGPSPATSATARPTYALWIRNNDHDPAEVRVNDQRIAIACGASLDLTPGVQGLPDFPWTVSITTPQGGILYGPTSAGSDTDPAFLLIAGGRMLSGDAPATGPVPSCP